MQARGLECGSQAPVSARPWHRHHNLSAHLTAHRVESDYKSTPERYKKMPNQSQPGSLVGKGAHCQRVSSSSGTHTVQREKPLSQVVFDLHMCPWCLLIYTCTRCRDRGARGEVGIYSTGKGACCQASGPEHQDSQGRETIPTYSLTSTCTLCHECIHTE